MNFFEDINNHHSDMSVVEMSVRNMTLFALNDVFLLL